MSIKTDKILIDTNLYNTTWKDDLYNSLYQYLFDEEILKDLTDTGIEKMEYGKDFMCSFTELFLYQELINFLILLIDEVSKITTEEEYWEIIEDSNLECIRKNFFCKYLSVEVFDEMLRLSGISLKIAPLGLDFMILEGASSTGFIIA